MRKKFPYGYRDHETPMMHDTDQVIREAFGYFGMVTPDPNSNRSHFLLMLDVARLFRAAYRVRKVHANHPERIRRVSRDVRDYLSKGELPDYLKRVWFAHDVGEGGVQAHMRTGRSEPHKFLLE